MKDDIRMVLGIVVFARFCDYSCEQAIIYDNTDNEN